MDGGIRGCSVDRLAHGGGVHDRQHLFEVLGEQPVEQNLVAVAHVGQENVLGQVVGWRWYCAYTRRSWPSNVETPLGSRPSNPSSRRSAWVNAVPRFSIGVVNTARPRARIRTG